MAMSQASSPTPGGDGDDNGERQSRRPAARRPVPTPADVFPPRRRRPAPPPPPPQGGGEGDREEPGAGERAEGEE
ncbi:hypothetical protein [Streptomyces sedi]|uniref:Uncharacterized protein n=1 Tax=Streptomyces sedi TaxID=555059 RepID=A0A5C4UWF8_9ACTN|nr:hypothetical protein [Streptomyces sedi]TNM27990.1 hypothetical protein FH715_19625 [Streptomyces sedi]